MKKGQQAMEFLMTYGWAILVVLVAIGALAYFGVLDPNKFLPEKCILDSSEELFCTEFEISSSENAIGLVVKNTRDVDILVENSVLVENNVVGNCTQREEVVIARGEEEAVIFDCENLVEDERFRGDITLEFVVLESRLSTTGIIVGKVE